MGDVIRLSTSFNPSKSDGTALKTVNSRARVIELYSQARTMLSRGQEIRPALACAIEKIARVESDDIAQCGLAAAEVLFVSTQAACETLLAKQRNYDAFGSSVNCHLSKDDRDALETLKAVCDEAIDIFCDRKSGVSFFLMSEPARATILSSSDRLQFL